MIGIYYWQRWASIIGKDEHLLVAMMGMYYWQWWACIIGNVGQWWASITWNYLEVKFILIIACQYCTHIYLYYDVECFSLRCLLTQTSMTNVVRLLYEWLRRWERFPAFHESCTIWHQNLLEPPSGSDFIMLTSDSKPSGTFTPLPTLWVVNGWRRL